MREFFLRVNNIRNECETNQRDIKLNVLPYLSLGYTWIKAFVIIQNTNQFIQKIKYRTF